MFGNYGQVLLKSCKSLQAFLLSALLFAIGIEIKERDIFRSKLKLVSKEQLGKTNYNTIIVLYSPSIFNWCLLRSEKFLFQGVRFIFLNVPNLWKMNTRTISQKTKDILLKIRIQIRKHTMKTWKHTSSPVSQTQSTLFEMSTGILKNKVKG